MLQPTSDRRANRYLAPGWATRRLMNPVVTRLVMWGVSIKGARQLQVRGRTSGEWRSVPVNVLELDDHMYLVAPRGHTNWVRNLRVAGTGRLRSGRRVDAFTAREVADADKAPILRAYLERWAFEVGQFFESVDARSPDTAIEEIAPGFPVFEISIN